MGPARRRHRHRRDAARVGGAAAGVGGLADLAAAARADRHTRPDHRGPWPEPALALPVDPDDGPVLVEVAYEVPEDRAERFRAAMAEAAVSRRRTGALRWNLYQDAADPRRWVEVFEVASWSEHLRQHGARLTGYDAELLTTARDLAEGEPEVRHLVPPAGEPARP
ncbi:MFS transporter [Streptomyces albidoflavus]|uniref:MFS transporter n=1 Tax=Streptomyces albidoflavus TaxID=1886 RepID=UPI003435E9CD